MHNIQIDSEFQALIPPLSAEERAQLEANLLADGCRDPLVVWPQPTMEKDWSENEDGSDVQTYAYADSAVHHEWHEDEGKRSFRQWGDSIDYVTEDEWPCILIDGHNRYEICTRLGLPFEVVVQEFSSRDHATEWIIKNQFGRRNLSDYQRGVLALRMKPIMEERAKANQAAMGGALREKSREVDAPIRTDEAVANLAHISSNTIRKIEHIEEVAAPEVKALAAAGDVSINLAAQFADLPQETQQEALAAIAQSEPAKEVMREAVHNHRAQGTGENEWYTPQTHLDAAYEVLGSIDLDPASSEIANKTVQADRIFTIEDDGLTKEWAGRVWMNPPVCGCRVHPKLVKLGDGNKNLPSLPESLASHIGLVLAQSGHAVSGLLVQGLRQGEGAITAARETEFPGKETKTSGGKTAVLQERKGSGEQEAAIHCGQPQAQGEASSRAVDVEQGGMGPSEARMGLRLRILRDAVGAVDTGSLHSFISSCLSGDGAKQYGPMLPELQLQQGVSDGSRLDQGQASVCPDCGLAGYSVAVPSRVFMNPPYAQPFIAQFVEKLASEYEAGRVTEAISLTHNYTDTVWFHRAAKSCAAICFTRGRIGFLSPEGKRAAPTQGQAFFYYGSKVAEFVSSFSRIGFVVEVRND